MGWFLAHIASTISSILRMSISIVLILSTKLLYQKQPLVNVSFMHVFYPTSSWIYKEILFHCILHFLGSEWPLLPFCLQSGFRRSNLLKICSFCACILLYKQLDNTHKEFLSLHRSQFLGLEYPLFPFCLQICSGRNNHLKIYGFCAFILLYKQVNILSQGYYVSLHAQNSKCG